LDTATFADLPGPEGSSDGGSDGKLSSAVPEGTGSIDKVSSAVHGGIGGVGTSAFVDLEGIVTSRREEGTLAASPRYNGAAHGTAPEDVRHERQGPAAAIAAPQFRATLYDRVEQGRTQLAELERAVAAAEALYCGFLDLAEDQPELACGQIQSWTASFNGFLAARLRRDAHWKQLFDLESGLCQVDHDSDVYLVSRGLPSTAGAAPGGVWTLSEKELAAAHSPRGVSLGGPSEGPASSACAASRPPASSHVAGPPATPSAAS
jgi:hypothetical protein